MSGFKSISTLHLKERWLDAALIIILVIAALSVRVPIAAERKIMPAGDAFNFQSIAENILHFRYPSHENRLPGYPILIIITRLLPVDVLQAAVGISIAMSCVTLICLYAVGRTLDIHRVPLFAILGLSIFDPLLTVSAVRPLADSTFIACLSIFILLLTRQLTSSKPVTTKSLVSIGVSTIAMIFTRFEGITIAALALPLLWIKLPWKRVLVAISIPFIVGLLWLPVHKSIHGSLSGGYVAALLHPNEDFGNVKAAPGKLVTLLRAAGWGATWTLPEYENEQSPKDEAFSRIVSQGSWWLSILGCIGFAWLLVTKRVAALPLIAAIIGYIGILMWWFLYSRFVTPLVPIFYLTAAAGGSFLLVLIQRLMGHFFLTTPQAKKTAYAVSLVVAGAFFGWIMWQDAPGLTKQGIGNAWESNNKGYALLQAVRTAGNNHEVTAYWTEEHLFAGLYLRQNGFYFSRHPKESPAELYSSMQKAQVQNIVDFGDDARIPQVIALLKQRGNIKNTLTYQEYIWQDNDFETVPVHQLNW